jgi:DegV family protein with EDD domain
MPKVSLIVGQSASLPKQTMEKYSLTMIPFVVDWKTGKEDLDPKSIFQKMADAEADNSDDLPKTSHPAPWLFKKFFEEKLKNSDSVLFVSLSSKLSGTFEAALSGKEMLTPEEKEKIFIFDCQNVSAGEGLIAIKAAEMIGQGKPVEEIIGELKIFSQKVHSLASLKSLKWLEKGGRISHLAKFFLFHLQKLGGNVLFEVKNGRIEAINLGFGQKTQAAVIFDFFKKNCKKGKFRVAISHAQNERSADELKNFIQKECPETEMIFIGPIDNIIGIHTGPGALICSWHPLS